MTLYRKPQPYRKPRTYRGAEVVAGVGEPSAAESTRAPWAAGSPRHAVTRLAHSEGAPADMQTATRWSAGAPVDRTATAPWRELDGTDHPATNPWADTTAHAAETDALRWLVPATRDTASDLPWAETATRSERATAVRWAIAAPHERPTGMPWGTATPHARELTAIWRGLIARGAYITLPWGAFGSRDYTTNIPYPIEPDPDQPGGSPLTVPFRNVYMMIPSLTAVILPARTPLRLTSFSIGTDVSQPDERFTAGLPRASLAALLASVDAPETPEIEVNVNGYPWIVSVTTHSDGRKFGSNSASIAGASRSRMLAAPNAALRSTVQTATRTIAQLATEELDGTGWTLVWDAENWTVPGGTWSYADLAPLEAIAQLAAAGGARVETHPTLLQLRIAPTYPVRPWLWGAESPWAILPASIVSALDGQAPEGPGANGVYVHCSATGDQARVTIAGTAGEPQARQVSDRLLTATEARQARGIHELAAGGKIKPETITTLLFPSPAEPGLIPIGALIDVQGVAASPWRGQVMGRRITASLEGEAVSVRQILQVERHFR